LLSTETRIAAAKKAEAAAKSSVLVLSPGVKKTAWIKLIVAIPAKRAMK